MSQRSTSDVLPVGSALALSAGFRSAAPSLSGEDVIWTVFADGFEAGTSAWSSVGSPGWGTTTYRFASGSRSAYCAGNSISPPGPYANNMNAWLIAGPFDLSAASSGALMFKVWANTELDYDLVKGMVSVDGTNYYGWSGSGNSLGWTDVSLDLNAVPTLGNICGRSQVWVAFIFRSDASNTAEGAYIDNVALLASSPPPTISGFSPSSGPAGTNVAIAGTNFNGASKVKFNGVSASFTVDSSTRITAIVPTYGTSGAITVTTPSGTATSPQSFTVLGPPRINGGPVAGEVGEQITLSGSGFIGVTSVTFNGTSAQFTVVSPTQLAATVPVGATSGPIAVTSPYGTATAGWQFIVAPRPRIASFSPSAGHTGSTVTLTGSGFTSVSAVYFKYMLEASFAVVSDSEIEAIVPEGAVWGPIIIGSTYYGTDATADWFKVLGQPLLADFIPTEGPVGTTVRLYGQDLTGASSVTFSGIPATFSVSDNSVILATVPPGATTGAIAVTTAGGTATTAASFSVLSKPIIGKPVCPAAVRHGTVFKVYGTLKPRFAARAKTVTVKAYRYTGGRWRYFRSYSAVNSHYYWYTKYTAKLAISRTGKYRFKASTRATAGLGAATSRYSRALTVR